MAIKSALRPESIVRTRPKSVQSAQNFISGGTPLGSSVVSSAANKIVGFQRAAVKPVTPDINSIVSTISSNILTQVDNSIRNATNITNRQVDGKLKQVAANITNQVQQVKQEQTNQVTQLQTVVQNIRQQTNNFVKQLSENYKKRVQDVDTAKPIGILDKFLKAYQNAIGFIQFFGKGKNIKQLREGLQTLKTSFTESFEIAKLIRQTILKIVTQLSNLPKATPGGSPGLNLDIDVPGGALKRTTPRNVRSVGRRGAGMLGLGLGAVAAGGAVNALADSDRLQSMPQVVGGLTGGIMDSFAFIVNKFANAVEEMIKGGTKKETPSTQPGPSSGGAPSSPASPGSSPGGGGSMGATDVTADTQEEKSWLQTLRKVEGTADSGGYNKLVGGEVVPELTQMTLQEIYDLGMKGRIGEGTLPQRFGGRKVKFGADSHAMGAYQFKPQTMLGVAKQLGLDPKTTVFSPEIQDKLGLKNLRLTGVDPTKRATQADIEKAGTQWAGLTPHWGQTKRTSAQSLEIYNKYYGSAQAKPDKGMGMLDGIDPSMIDAGQRKALGINISQPPPSQAKPSIVSLPLSGGQQASQPQSGGGGGQMVVPPEQKGPSVPLLPSSDESNFLTMYSKIVYNIIDG